MKILRKVSVCFGKARDFSLILGLRGTKQNAFSLAVPENPLFFCSGFQAQHIGVVSCSCGLKTTIKNSDFQAHEVDEDKTSRRQKEEINKHKKEEEKKKKKKKKKKKNKEDKEKTRTRRKKKVKKKNRKKRKKGKNDRRRRKQK